MSAKTTLAAFKAILVEEFPNLTIYTTVPSIPFEEPGPAMILSERHQGWRRMFTGVRGMDGNSPNLYTIVYIQATLQETGEDIETAVTTLRDNVEHLIQIFDNPNYDSLNGNVVRAGDTIILDYDPQGTFIEYLGNLYIGVYITIDVWEDYRFNNYNV